MGYSEYTSNKWRMTAGVILRKWLTQWDSMLLSITNVQKFLGAKVNNYVRIPTEYDYALFAFLYSGTVIENYDKNKHQDLLIKRCKHQNHHIHNTIALSPENLIFSVKLIKLFRDKSIMTFLTAEIVKYKIKDFHGEVFDNESKISQYIHFHIKTFNHYFIWAVYLAIWEIYEVQVAKKYAFDYLGFENVMKLNEHINLMEKDFIFEISSQQKNLNKDYYSKIENIDGFRKIVYRNFTEWAMKWMDLLWNEWQIEQNEYWVESGGQGTVAFFKKSIEESISGYQVDKDDEEYTKFMTNFSQKYGENEWQSNSVGQVINKLKSLTIDDVHIVNNDDMRVDTQSYSTFGSKVKKEEVKTEKQYYSEEEIDETIEYFDKAMNLEINPIALKKKHNRENLWLNRPYVWSDYVFYIDHILCFTLMFYFQIYDNLEEYDVDFVKDFKFSSEMVGRFNRELIYLCSNVDDLCKSNKDINTFKVFIWKLNEVFTSEWLDQNYHFNSLIGLLSDEHPLYSFQIEITHICTKILKRSTPFTSKKKKKQIHLNKGYLEWKMEDTTQNIIEFTDYFMDCDFVDTELSGSFTCCGSKKFKMKIESYPRFMWIRLNLNYLSKKVRRVWRFSPFVKPSAESVEKLELLAVMFMSARNYFCITKLRWNEDKSIDGTKWCIYNPLFDGEFAEIPEENIDDSVLVISDNDFEKDVYPCLLLYSKCN